MQIYISWKDPYYKPDNTKRFAWNSMLNNPTLAMRIKYDWLHQFNLAD